MNATKKMGAKQAAETTLHPSMFCCTYVSRLDHRYFHVSMCCSSVFRVVSAEWNLLVVVLLRLLNVRVLEFQRFLDDQVTAIQNLFR